MSSPPSTDAEFRYSTATLDWARDEHATLDEWPTRRATPHRVRAERLTRSLRSLLDRLRT
ncbi:hypothetical protein [Halorussus halobius]|uniref:hypothetical protein n=1 Tax=Halorussus halobius TaxID=1710537 RepID=UPI0010925258|nr:hypothetical protein [Halorussus halobius]